MTPAAPAIAIKGPGNEPAEQVRESRVIRELLDKAAMQMVAKQEAEYRAAIDACGGSAWTPEQIKQRCRMVRIAGLPHETLHIDNVPVLEVHPIRSELSDSNMLTITQDYRRLYPPESQTGSQA